MFLLYFLLRRDNRAALTALASFAGATLVGFVLAWNDSWEYWTHTVHHTDRIGETALNTDQNIAGALARLGLGEHERFLLWVAACLLVLAVTVWAMRRVLRAGEPTLAVICVALFGLVVSPVSWSHHWVWMLPAVLVTGILAWRRRNVALAVLTAVGVALMRWTPIDLLPKHHETTADWWRQLAGCPTCGGRWRSSSPPGSPSPPARRRRIRRRGRRRRCQPSADQPDGRWTANRRRSRGSARPHSSTPEPSPRSLRLAA